MLPRRLALAGVTAILAIGLLPLPVSAGATVDRASMLLETSYLLRTWLDFSAGTLSVSERITIRNLSSKSISKVNLSMMPKAFGELTSIWGFSVDRREVPAAWTNDSNLELQLGRDLASGASAVIRLKFRLRASGDIGTSLEGRLSKANGIMQVSHWFPIVSNGHDTRYPGDSQYTRTAKRIRLEITTDASNVRIAAPGRVISSSGRDHIFEITNARDFAFGASPGYRVVSGVASGVSVVAYYTTGAASTALSYAKAALARFEGVFGEYQWPRFVIAQTGRSASGNEFPGIVFLGGPLFSSRAAVVHEVAHQWWYAMAGNHQLKEPWLDEGMAEFATRYFYGGFRSYESTLPVNSSIYDFPDVPAPLTSGDPDSYDQTVYFKAARFLNGVRSRMGTTRFFDALRSLFRENRNGVVTTAEFYATMVRYGAPRDYLDRFIRR